MKKSFICGMLTIAVLWNNIPALAGDMDGVTPPWEIEEIEGDTIAHETLNPVYVDDQEIEVTETPDDNEIMPIAEDDIWDAMLSMKYGDSYNKPYQHDSSAQNIVGDTNRLVIEETDLNLPGRNGLDLKLTRKYDNQYYNGMQYGVGTHNTYRVNYKVYKYKNISTDDIVNIGFITEDQMYTYMYDELCISSLNDVRMYYDSTARINFYPFKNIYEKKADSGIILKRLQDEDPINASADTNSTYIVQESLENNNTGSIGAGWKFILPNVVLYATHNGYNNSAHTVSDSSFEGTFCDINGTINSFTGTTQINYKDLSQSSYRTDTPIKGNDVSYNIYYDGNHFVDNTDLEYNFTAASSGYTYYLYCDKIDDAVVRAQFGGRFNMRVVAIKDNYDNMIQYYYNSSGKISRIIDTYGHEINIAGCGTEKCTVSYIGDNDGSTKTITYTTQTLPSNSLDNDSPIKNKEVTKFSVTNQNNETTEYWARRGTLASFYQATALRDVNDVPSVTESTAINSQYNIEKIKYPTGAETRYRYKCITIAERRLKLAKQLYAVDKTYDIIDGNIEREREYIFENDSYALTKTEKNNSKSSKPYMNMTTDTGK